MKTKDIRNGSLYFNLKRNRVERVISNTFSKTRVVTEFHKKDQMAIPSTNLRLASSDEVTNYLTPPPKRGILSIIRTFALLGSKPAQKSLLKTS